MYKSLSLLLLAIFLTMISSCSESKKVENYSQLEIKESSENYDARVSEIMEKTPLEVAEGLQVSLWATDSLAPDPIAMSIDDYGRVYLTRTNRQKHSEFDIRGYQQWMIESISLQTPEERRAFLRKTFAPEKSEENSWLKDMNNDGSHDWKDLAVEKDEVWMLEDQTGDGKADVSTRIIEDFNEEITDVANALLVRRNDMFVGIGPDMWRITDENNDGIMDSKESISTGYAVHIGFSGHGMSGAVEGPDGKIYWGIGDIGASITAKNGEKFHYPNQGVLVRSNPDGSDFEVFAAGLRNTHEFVFDEYGNIIGADNDGDHRGERERLVYIVEGSDAGWRTNWQFGKYIDPLNNSYKVWMDEKLHIPRWEGQAAYIIPPIQNFHNGPTGMIYNPGTALGSKWRNKFFLVEFTGTPTRSPIWAFSLKPSGASFELVEEQKALSGILPTGIRFGPDGALYAADWINGWGTKNYGRVWKLDVTEEENDLAEEREKTLSLMQLDYESQESSYLGELLYYPDMRIRQKAQFELASRGEDGVKEFQNAILQKSNQLARIHAIWGMGQIARASGNLHSLPVLLSDDDPEIVAQTIKLLGDLRHSSSAADIVPHLSSDSDRIKFFAAQALGRMEFQDGVEPLIQMIRENDDKDVYLRHAAVLALSRIGDVDAIKSLENDEDQSVRIAAVLVMRRLRNENVRLFLDDESEYIVTEAARAINDDWSIAPALPDLAAVLKETRFTSEPLLRRAINAASRVAGKEQIDDLIRFANRIDANPELRAEAIAVLGNWGTPSVLDRVDGRNRGLKKRDDQYVRAEFGPLLGGYLDDHNTEIVIAAIGSINSLETSDHISKQVKMAVSHPDAEVRAAQIKSLAILRYDGLEEIMRSVIKDKSEEVRTAAISVISNLDVTRDFLTDIAESVFRNGSVREQQQMLSILGNKELENTSQIFERLISQYAEGSLNPGISLELIEAVDSTRSEKLIAMMDPHRLQGNTTADYQDALYGGNSRRGGAIVFGNAAAQCMRCHAWDENPTSVGPSLRGVADRLSREQLLESLIEPSARLAPGYGSVVLTLTDGTTASGILLEENEDEIILKTSNAEPLEISVARVSKRTNVPSNMPAMGNVLSRKEIRDVVEFLSNLKE